MAAAGIYIHIPFCERKCSYCAFNTTDFDRKLAHSYVDAVCAEIEWRGRNMPSGIPADFLNRSGSLAVDTVYFGGGTPSIVDAGHIARIVECCDRVFDLESGSEITIEINPGSLERSRIDRWIAGGVNRASVGVQSFIDRELVSLNRTHDSAAAVRTVGALREAGIANLSLDLIAGLPGQTLEGWEYNLGRAIDLMPGHLSLYLLEIKEGTQLHVRIEKGLQAVPDDQLAAEMYEGTRRATREAGYEQYEISNFALNSGDEFRSPLRSRHNMKYWTGDPFIGFGCGAHSYDTVSRWSNVLQSGRYIELVSNGEPPVSDRRELSERERAVEALFMELRLIEGVDQDRFRRRHGVEARSLFGEELDRLETDGLVETEGQILRLTDRGVLFSNEVFVALV